MSISRRAGLNFGTFEESSESESDRFEATRTYGRTRTISRSPARTLVEMRITWRAALASPDGRKLVALAHDGCGALGEGAAQRRLDPLGQRREVRLAVERNEDGAAHQRGAAQAGQDRAGEPLNGDAAAIDQSDRRAVHQQWRFVAEIDRLSGWSQTIWIAPSALIQAPCPLHRRDAVAPRSHPKSPATAQQNADRTLARQLPAAPARLPTRYVIRTVTTGLSPDGTTREECGTSAARAAARRSGAGAGAVHSAKLRRILRLSVLTRVGGGPI